MQFICRTTSRGWKSWDYLPQLMDVHASHPTLLNMNLKTPISFGANKTSLFGWVPYERGDKPTGSSIRERKQPRMDPSKTLATAPLNKPQEGTVEASQNRPRPGFGCGRNSDGAASLTNIKPNTRVVRATLTNRALFGRGWGSPQNR